jgi:hypothetical protein
VVVGLGPIVLPPASLADLDSSNGFRLDDSNRAGRPGRGRQRLRRPHHGCPRAERNGGLDADESFVVFGSASGF